MNYNLIKILLLLLITTTTTQQQQQQKPIIVKDPSNVIVNLSDPVTLACSAKGDPKPVITWYKDNQLIDINNKPSTTTKYTLIHDSNLFIFSVGLAKGNKSDSGVYHCQAENEYGIAKSQNATLLVTCKYSKNFNKNS
jgi:hypothetical protein